MTVSCTSAVWTPTASNKPSNSTSGTASISEESVSWLTQEASASQSLLATSSASHPPGSFTVSETTRKGLVPQHFTVTNMRIQSAPIKIELLATTSTVTPPRLRERRKSGEPFASAMVIGKVMSPSAAVAIVTSATAGTAVAAVIGPPQAVTKGPAVGALSRVARCKFVEDDVAPSLTDFPLQVSIGSSQFALYVGSGLLTTIILLLLPQVVALLNFFSAFALRGEIGCQTTKLRTAIQAKVLANGAGLVLGYFGPLTFKLPSMILWHSRTASDIAIAVSCPVVVLILIGSFAFCVIRLVPRCVRAFRFQGNELEYENRVPGSLFVETFGFLFDAARSTALIHRLLFFEDFAVAAVLQILEGIRPARSATCGITATLMAAVCIAHTVYLIAARPYGDRLELILAIVGSSLMCVTGFLAMVIAQMDDSDPEVRAFEGGDDAQMSATIFVAFGYVVLINNIFFLIQTGILSVAALAEIHKRRLRKQLDQRSGGKNENLAVQDQGEPEGRGGNRRTEVFFGSSGSPSSKPEVELSTGFGDLASNIQASLHLPLLQGDGENPLMHSSVGRSTLVNPIDNHVPISRYPGRSDPFAV